MGAIWDRARMDFDRSPSAQAPISRYLGRTKPAVVGQGSCSGYFSAARRLADALAGTTKFGPVRRAALACASGGPASVLI